MKRKAFVREYLVEMRKYFRQFSTSTNDPVYSLDKFDTFSNYAFGNFEIYENS